MAQPTTTLADVITDITNILRALTPTAIANVKFDRCPVDQDLRTWAAKPNLPILRRFELARPDGRAEPGILDPSATLLERDLELVIAYPRKLARVFGNETVQGTQAIEDVIEADAHLISVTLWNADNLTAGVTRQAPTIGATDKTFDDVWFLSVFIHVQWFQATDIT